MMEVIEVPDEDGSSSSSAPPSSSSSSSSSSSATASSSGTTPPEAAAKAPEIAPAERAKGQLIDKVGTTSHVWEHFQVWSLDPGVAACKLCSTLTEFKIGVGKAVNTSTLTRHLESKHLVEYKQILQKKNGGAGQTAMSQFLVNNSRPIQREATLRWLVANYQPYSVVEQPTFRDMIHSYNKSAEVISSKCMKSMVLEKSEEVKAVLDEAIKGQKGAITTDGWTSSANNTYYGFTFHWIDNDWVLRSCPLGLCVHSGTSKAGDHLRELKNEMDRHNITYNDIVAVVTDTEPTMNAAGRDIVAAARAAGNMHLDHIGCVAHIIQTTTKKTAADPDNIAVADPEAGALKAARALVTTINESSQINEKLFETQDSLNANLPPEQRRQAVTVIQDVKTRWWSTYSMVERLLRLKDSLNFMAAGRMITNNLSAAQWNLLKQIEVTLEPFMLAQQILEGEKYVTLSLVPRIIVVIRKRLIAARDGGEEEEEEDGEERVANSEYMQRILTTLLDSFNTEWGDGVTDTMYDEHLQPRVRQRHRGFRVLHMLAAFLDPRHKDLRVFGDGDKNKIYNEVNRRCELIAAAAPPQQPPPQRAAAGGGGRPRPRKRDLYALFDDDGIDLPAAAAAPAGGVEGPIDREIRDYKALPVLTRTRIIGAGPNAGEIRVNNPLDWWKDRSHEFPILATLARRVLCIPATSAPSERLFSHAGLTIANDRARLLPQNAAELIYLHDAWPVAEALVAGVAAL
jgi:hypothetical protein